jgi:hypothetical protein
VRHYIGVPGLRLLDDRAHLLFAVCRFQIGS